MIRGLETFKKYFAEHTDSYVIIGGTACDILLDEAGLTARATKDIDIILVVEVLNAEFIQHFWQFIEDGKYERAEKSDNNRKYYRFAKPKTEDFPFQIELFARNPDLEGFDDAHLVPIPVEDDLESLSAILLDDDYYHYILEQSNLKDDVHLAKTEALICLKAKAYIEIEERIADGSKEDTRQLKKHKGDIFRLAVLLTADSKFELPDSIKAHLQEFANRVSDALPNKDMFKALGLGAADPEAIYQQLKTSFNLD